MKDFTLVMSASLKINPNGLYHVSRESTENREDQYIRTLQFYASQPCIRKILFVDNSNADLSRIRAATSSAKIEYLSLDCNNYPGKYGKGYGESLLLDNAVDYLIAHEGNAGYMIKVTGRFPILNIKQMVREFEARKGLALAVDVIERPLYDWLHLNATGHSCRTIIYACSFDFYKKHIYGLYVSNPEAYHGAEHFMRSVWCFARNAPGVYSRFKIEPRLSGQAGGTMHWGGVNYDGFWNTLKRGIRQMIRWVAPFLWI